MPNNFIQNSDGKNSVLRQAIIAKFVKEGSDSIADISGDIGVSIATVTKLVGELIDEGIIEEIGKLGTSGGRRPSIYGLNPRAGYFVGVEVRAHHISMAITDFKGEICDYQEDIPFAVEKTEASFKALCEFLKDNIGKAGFDRSKILAYGFNFSGRVNSETGYCFSYFISEGRTVCDILKDELEAEVYVENDSRAMTYREYK